MNKFLFAPGGEWLITFIASLLIWLLFGGLIILWLIDGKFKKETVLHALFAFVLAWGLAELTKSLIPTVRPFRLNGFPPLTLTVPGIHSFPSSHAASSFALAFTVWLRDKKVGYLYLLGAILVSLGRILANVHYPMDVLGGAGLGIITSYLIEKFKFLSFFPSKNRATRKRKN